MSDENPIPETLTIIAQKSVNIDTTVYRGTAPLCDLTYMSAPDIYDQVNNPRGLQRDLSKRHSLDAYDYAAQDSDPKHPRAFPEVQLNVRDKKIVAVEELTEVEGVTLVKITVDMASIVAAHQKGLQPKVSRVDGNHRLFYGGGDGSERPALAVTVPFSLTIGLSREQESTLFLAMNANQKGLNTSHLRTLEMNTSTDNVELVRHPERVFARRLALEDELSPFKDMVHMGGSKTGAKAKGMVMPLTFTALSGAVKRMLKADTLTEIGDSDAKYKLIRDYWTAVAKTWPEAFEDPTNYLLTKSIGVNVMAQLGCKVLDRAWASGEMGVDDLAKQLAHVKDVFDWHREAPNNGVQGMNGNTAILTISGQLVKRLPKLKEAVRA